MVLCHSHIYGLYLLLYSVRFNIFIHNNTCELTWNRLTHTAPHPTRLAKVNGAGAAWSCLARSIGPLVVGPVFDLSRKQALIPLPFWILTGFSAIAIPQSWLLNDQHH